ncbi:MAG: nicotinate-nicotinamide nucleotide adenylyltransferase, partial [Clostridiales bacterium]|nr:nicotinate-nicotinamide nucleotide adenylyltransferase [Clostridiales bacterium]
MRIGLMGGTFDPIHWGHIHMAKAAADELALDKVIFLPDGDPPHKAPQTPGAFRLRMAQLAAELDPRFDSSDRELRRKGRTYTVDTLEEYKALCPDRRMIYIVGSDTLRLFPSWR